MSSKATDKANRPDQTPSPGFDANSSPKLFKIPALVEGKLRLGIDKSKRPEKAQWLVDEFTLPFKME